MAPLYSVTLAGAESLPPATREALEVRFQAEIDRIFGSHEAAAGSLNHWEDDGGELLEPIPWSQAVRQVADQVLAFVEVPAAAHFRCELAEAFYGFEPDADDPKLDRAQWPEPEHKAPF